VRSKCPGQSRHRNPAPKPTVVRYATDSDHITEMGALRRSIKPSPSARALVGTPNLMGLSGFRMTENFGLGVERPAEQGGQHLLQSSDEMVGFASALGKVFDLIVFN